MITDAQFAAWLDSSGALRVTLFEIGVHSGGVDQVRYLSNAPYLNGDDDTPYLAVVAGGLSVNESISLTGSPALTAGDIEIDNTDGALDSWLDDVWKNQRVRAYVGDQTWARSDFRQVFEGVVADIASRTRDHLNLIISNKMELLNTAVTEATVGGTGLNADDLLPLPLGEVHNMAPKLINESTLEYAVSSRAVLATFETRDTAKPVETSRFDSTGRFRLISKGVGQITCSVQGDAAGGVYLNTIAPLVRRLITEFGNAAAGLTDADIDETNFTAFDLTNPEPVGRLLADRANVAETCQALAGSVGAQLVPSRAGLFRLIQLAFPTTAAVDIQANAQLDRTIEIVDRTDVAAAVKIAYCRNYTVQTGLQTTIPDAHKALFGQEWLTKTATDPAIKALYKITDEPKQQETDLLCGADADAEARRRLAVFKQVRTTYRFQGTPSNMLLELGQAVRLFSNRFSLVAGKVGLVTGLAVNTSNMHVTVEVTI